MGLKLMINNPEQVIDEKKFLKIQEFIFRNQEVFIWIQVNKDKLAYNCLVWCLARLVEITLELLDHLLKTQGQFEKVQKTPEFVKIRDTPLGESWKKLLKKNKKSKKNNQNSENKVIGPKVVTRFKESNFCCMKDRKKPKIDDPAYFKELVVSDTTD